MSVQAQLKEEWRGRTLVNVLKPITCMNLSLYYDGEEYKKVSKYVPRRQRQNFYSLSSWYPFTVFQIHLPQISTHLDL